MRENHAHGIPIAWMLASNSRQETILYFLRLNHLRSPGIDPRYIMSDFDWAQINACKIVSVDWKRINNEQSSFILLCWWHVLHAWQQHFHIPQSPELWELLKKWIRMENREDFDKRGTRSSGRRRINKFVEYLEDTWMKDEVVAMWSAVYHGSRSILGMSVSHRSLPVRPSLRRCRARGKTESHRVPRVPIRLLPLLLLRHPLPARPHAHLQRRPPRCHPAHPALRTRHGPAHPSSSPAPAHR
jgi:hypothetical protein